MQSPPLLSSIPPPPPPSPHFPLLSHSPFSLQSLLSSHLPLSSHLLPPHTPSSLSYNHSVPINNSFIQCYIFRCRIEEMYKMILCKNCMRLITELLICSPPSPLNIPPPSPHFPLLSPSPFSLHSLLSSHYPLSSHLLPPHTPISLSYNLPCSPYVQLIYTVPYIKMLYRETV
jgi:hypothetical protein